MTIYRDCLGRPEPKATISVFGAAYGQPGKGYLALTSISDCPVKRWPYLSRDVASIVAEMEAEGWLCAVDVDGYNAPVIRCTHQETQSALDNLTRNADIKFAGAERGYIRFGRCPKDGKSINHRDNTTEQGVSVFEAEFAGKDYRIIVTPVLECSYHSVKDRPAYRIYGDVVGTGADGEPVVRVTKAVKLT